MKPFADRVNWCGVQINTLAKHPLFASSRRAAAGVACALAIGLVMEDVRAEADYPTGPVFVASMEILIERCSQHDPRRADQYAAVREVWNKAFAKHNYEEIKARPSYSEARQKLLADHADQSPDLAMYCDATLNLLATPPKGVWNYE